MESVQALVASSCYIKHPLDEEESAIFWFDVAQSGEATLLPMIRTPGKCVKAKLVGLPTLLTNQKYLEVLDRLRGAAIERFGNQLILLPGITEPYDEWQRRLPNAHGQEKAEFQIRITRVESWINAYYWGVINYDRGETMIACNRLASAYLSLGEAKAAETCFRKILSLALILNQRSGIEAAYGGLGIVYNNLGKYDKAIEFQQKALIIAKEIVDRQGEGAAYCNLGNSCRFLGKYDRAIEFHQEHLDIAREIGNLDEEGGAYGNLGVAYFYLGKYDKAIEFQRKALIIAKETGDLRSEGTACGNLGNAYDSLGQYKEAIEFHQRHLDTAKEIGDRDGEARACGNLGNTYNSVGQWEKAIVLQKECLRMTKGIGAREGEANAYGNLGNVYDSLGQYDKAIEFHQKNLDISTRIGDRKGKGRACGNLGVAYQALKQYYKAIEFYEEGLIVAKEIGNRRGESQFYGNLGNAYYSLGQHGKAIECYQKCLKMAKEIGDRRGEGAFYGNLGLTYKHSDQPAEAESAFKKAIRIFSKVQYNLSSQNHEWQISIFENLFYPYRNLEAMLIEQSRFSEALEIADLGRSRALAALVGRKSSLPPQEQVPTKDLQKVAAELKSTIVFYSSNVHSTDEVVAWVISPQGAIAFETLQVGEAVATVVAGNVALNALTARTEEAVAEGLSRMTRQLTDQCETPTNSEEMHEQLQKWHQLLIAPLLPHLPTEEGARVAIIADASLHNFPFAILRDQERNYLIEKYTLFTAPSIETLRRLMNRPKRSVEGRPLVIADPDNNLPFSNKEGVRIGRKLAATSLIREEATLARVKEALTSASLIHFTGHGSEGKTNPQSVFSGALKMTDGLLPSEEIVNLDIKADLVVLNGCSTGKGELKMEGLIGPPHAFLGAGASSVVGTQWVVLDAVAQKLMVDFHARVGVGAPKAEALREAMLGAMKGCREEPWRWGAFQLIGLPQ